MRRLRRLQKLCTSSPRLQGSAFYFCGADATATLVRSAVVHVIASVEADKTFQKAGRHDLSFQLKGFRRADEGTGGACDQTGRIFGIDQELTALIHSVMSPETFRVVTLAVVRLKTIPASVRIA